MSFIMISSISGVITSIENHKLCVQTNIFGLEIFCPQAHTLDLQQSITLHTYLHWNQEQGPSLFGFLHPLDKEVFLLILSCAGIGPKLGLSILEQIESSQFLHLVSEENIVQLSTLKNIGQKKAEQICLSLKNKAPKLLTHHPHLATKLPTSLWRDLQETLSSLNYSPGEIKQTTAILRDETKELNLSFDLLLRKALQILSKK